MHLFGYRNTRPFSNCCEESFDNFWLAETGSVGLVHGKCPGPQPCGCSGHHLHSQEVKAMETTEMTDSCSILSYQACQGCNWEAGKGTHALGDLHNRGHLFRLSLHLGSNKSHTSESFLLQCSEIIFAKCIENGRMVLFLPPDFEITVTVSGLMGVCDSLSPSSQPPFFLFLSRHKLSLWKGGLALAQCYPYSAKFGFTWNNKGTSIYICNFALRIFHLLSGVVNFSSLLSLTQGPWIW